MSSPDHFNYIPACASEYAFQLLDYLAVAANGSVESLQITINNKNKVVELLPSGLANSAERFRLISFAISQKCPDFPVRVI